MSSSRSTRSGGLISQHGETRYIGPAKRETSALRGRSKRPLVQAGMTLLELPMDLILEILSFLQPIDLLGLLATCKTLCRLLCSKETSKQIWASSRRNVDKLPDCPEDLTEVAYAKLIFENHCQCCQQGRSYDVRTVRVWSARVRLCGECFDVHFVQKETGRRALQHNPYPDAVKKLLPTRLAWHGHQTVFEPFDKIWAKEYKRLRTEDAKEKWVQEKIRTRKIIEENSAQLAQWYHIVWEPEVVRRKDQVFRQRQDQIMDRLRSSGWDTELQINRFCDNLLDDRRVRKACEKDLTDEVLDDMQEYLVPFIEQAQARRLNSTPTQQSTSRTVQHKKKKRAKRNQ